MSISNFFNVLYSTGNLYNYQVEIPAINLIKLHGSLNWETKDEKDRKPIPGRPGRGVKMKRSFGSGKVNKKDESKNLYKDKKFLIVEKTVSPVIRGADKKKFGGVG